MLSKQTIAAGLLAMASTTMAQRPSNTTMCDYYTTALLKDNTAANQYTLLTLLVNTAVIGNYTKPNVGVTVTGILNKGTYMGTSVNLLPYFDGGLASTNSDTNPGTPTAVNFLDGGGAAPLLKNMPADDTTSAQYFLLTHLYSYFGALLGCSGYGTSAFPSYAGSPSQFNVHRFMDLNSAQVGYFITQVGLAAASFGVTDDDVTAVGKALTSIFDVKCAPPTTVIPAQGAQLQSICVAEDCALAENATCSSYPAVMEPYVANASLADGEGQTSSVPSGYSTMAASSSAMMASSSGAMATSSAPAYTSMAGTSAATSAMATYTGAASPMQAGLGAVAAGAAFAVFAL